MSLLLRSLPGRPTALLALALLALAAPARAGADDAKGEAALEPAPVPETTRRVVYLPDSVKAQLKEELKQEVLQQAAAEGWAAPHAVPEWTRYFRLHADVRLRWEMVWFQKDNANTGEFNDFNAINQGAPFDVLGVDLTNDRYLNVDQNRRRPRVRARLGLDVEPGHGFQIQLRLASGDGSSPVSTNQTLGGGAGDFSKYQVWIDRAALRYDPFQGRPSGFTLQGGRFGKPFFSTDLIWWEDLGFDGLSVQAWAGTGAFKGFLNGGVFPYFITGYDFPAEQSKKLRSFDKWLVGGQLGFEVKPSDAFSASAAVAYYYFDHIEGRVGGPCDTNLKGFTCDTDASRPAFAQKGNTYLALRTPSVAALNAEATGLAPEYQYFGLSSLFRELAVTARVAVRPASPLQLTLEGEFVRNVGFSGLRIAPRALNNRGPCDAAGQCPFVGGRDGYLGRLTLGSPSLTAQWSWAVAVTYRSLESDAVVDAFTDPDFGLGGTNLRGYIVSASVALTDQVMAKARWLSANAIAGPPLGVDVLQLDLSASF